MWARPNRMPRSGPNEWDTNPVSEKVKLNPSLLTKITKGGKLESAVAGSEFEITPSSPLTTRRPLHPSLLSSTVLRSEVVRSGGEKGSLLFTDEQCYERVCGPRAGDKTLLQTGRARPGRPADSVRGSGVRERERWGGRRPAFQQDASACLEWLDYTFRKSRMNSWADLSVRPPFCSTTKDPMKIK